jgi:glycosyltransferase involved in cell wall biosynthesis
MLMQDRPKVSIIVPVKNIRHQIQELVSDVKSQSVTDWELLLITGVSDDGTDEVCHTMAEEDERIQVLLRKEEGVSAARNCGIEHAKGDYLVFPDGDDRIDKEYLATLLSTIEEKEDDEDRDFPSLPVEMGMIGYITEVVEGDEELFFATPESGERVISVEDLLCRLFFLGNYQGYVWNKIFQRNIVMENDIRFDEDIYYHEDQLFLVTYLIHAQNVRWNPEQLYHYRMREDSAMGLTEPRDGLVPYDIIEKEATEVLSLDRMRNLLIDYPDAQWFCEQNEVYYALEILGKMEMYEDPDAFSDSAFRQMAKVASEIDYEAMDEWEEEALPRLEYYGQTGKLLEEGE